MPKTKEKMLIIDGNALVHRSFHALPPTMRTKAGEPTNAIYGFTTIVLKAIREFKPAYVALTFDLAAPTFRHKEYKEYKATRVKAPDELYDQLPRTKEIAAALGIPIYEKAGFEADDVIGTITARLDSGVEKIIVTGDMDTLQLVDDDTKVYTMSRGLTDSVLYDEAAVIARYGLKPAQMIDFKALRGDPSDNIPGVRGIGEKTAVDLLKEFNTLDKIYSYLENRKQTTDPPSLKLRRASGAGEKIKPRTVELLKEHKKEAYMSRDLATIRRNVPIDFSLSKARFGTFDQEKIVKLLSELEFKSLLPRFQQLAISQPATKEEREKFAGDKFERNRRDFKYSLIDNDRDFKKFIANLKKAKTFAVDTETSSFDPLTADLLGISFSWKDGEAYFIKTTENRQQTTGNLFDYRQNRENSKILNPPIRQAGLKSKSIHPWLKELKPILENEQIKKYGHNAKFDLRVLKQAGINVRGLEFDTMVASYLLNPGSRQHNLDALTFAEFGHEKISKNDLLGAGREKIGFSEVASEKLALYSGEDADFTNRLAKKLGPELKCHKLDRLFYELEMPLVPILAGIEDNGVLVDKKLLNVLGRQAAKKIKEIEAKIHGLAEGEFNINSTQQLREVLFIKLAIPADNISKIKTGLSTAADELNKLKDLHPIIPLVQEHRELNKLVSTYIDALPALINPATGRVHTSFNQAVTATGRLSSTEPNLQNIPVRTELGREIRKAFAAAPGYKFLSLDYSQIELRLAAHMSGDKKMIRAFLSGADIHTATAAEIFGINEEAVTKDMRREAKAVNFGILYGQGAHGLSATADIPYARAKEFIEHYFDVYKGIKNFIEAEIIFAREHGYVETLFGRRRYLPEINSGVVQVRKGAERMAVNTPLQGTAADMIKKAMIDVYARIAADGKRMAADSSLIATDNARMILQVHDELLFEVKEEFVEEAADKFSKVMAEVIKLKVPVVVDASLGDNWGELRKLEVRS